jgi:hypothetical protein
MSASAFESVVESVRAALNAKRGEAAGRVASIEAALRGYERALELEIAEAFAAEHGLKLPARGEHPLDAARKLANAVAALPELANAAGAASVGVPVSKRADLTTGIELEPDPAKPARVGGKFVIIGALSGREKSGSLPPELDAEVEWIDTERDGVHAVGNLPQRIRQGRVAAVVILDRIVSHKHTEPVVAAAREARVPVAFAGQGGKAQMARALQQIAEMRRERA